MNWVCVSRAHKSLRYLVHLLSSSNTYLQRGGAFALAMCCRKDARVTHAALQYPTLDAVVAVLRATNPHSIIFGTMIQSNGRVDVGGTYEVNACMCGWTGWIAIAAIVAGILCQTGHDNIIRALRQSNALTNLCGMLEMKASGPAQHAAAFALGAMCEDPEVQQYLLEHGMGAHLSSYTHTHTYIYTYTYVHALTPTDICVCESRVRDDRLHQATGVDPDQPHYPTSRGGRGYGTSGVRPETRMRDRDDGVQCVQCPNTAADADGG